jgi:transposase
MRKDVEVRLGPGDRERLAAIVADGNSAQKHVWRAQIILATAEGCGTAEIMRRAGVSKPCVWRWQRRFMETGVDGLLHDKTRKPGKAPVPQSMVGRLITRTLDPPPGETTHWTGRGMAKAMGLAVSTVQKIWRAHGLAPHRLRVFKLSRDPQFAAKVHDVVGLYVDPPAHSLVLSIDEKSQIQALDRTQPGLPMKKGRAGTMTHDYIRHGTTTLFAALNVLDGVVIGQCMQRPPAPRVSALPQPHRTRGSGWPADPRDPRQLRQP